jgi:hypothetical protein
MRALPAKILSCDTVSFTLPLLEATLHHKMDRNAYSLTVIVQT